MALLVDWFLILLVFLPTSERIELRLLLLTGASQHSENLDNFSFFLRCFICLLSLSCCCVRCRFFLFAWSFPESIPQPWPYLQSPDNILLCLLCAPLSMNSCISVCGGAILSPQRGVISTIHICFSFVTSHARPRLLPLSSILFQKSTIVASIESQSSTAGESGSSSIMGPQLIFWLTSTKRQWQALLWGLFIVAPWEIYSGPTVCNGEYL